MLSFAHPGYSHYDHNKHPFEALNVATVFILQFHLPPATWSDN